MVIMSFIESIMSKFRFDDTGFFLDAHERIDEKIRELEKQEERAKEREELEMKSKNNYNHGGLSLKTKSLEEAINNIRRYTTMESIRDERILRYLRDETITTEEAAELLFERWRESTQGREKTNQFNNQFILQSNASDHKSSYQCVVCGSFNVDKENYYKNDWNIVKKTITCGDCGNKFNKEND